MLVVLILFCLVCNLEVSLDWVTYKHEFNGREFFSWLKLDELQSSTSRK